MEPELRNALSTYLLSIADDELILGHRDSEWCGHAPILEEDIAFANLALDEMGHANLWYTALAGLLGEDPGSYPDRLVFSRQAKDYRNAQLLELPNGDWAFSMLRQYLFDSAELARLEGLSASQYPPLAGAAAKIRKEEIYHYRHTQAWIRRLSQGTEESRQRTQSALDQAWPYTRQLFEPVEGQEQLVAAGFTPEPQAIRRGWEQRVIPELQKFGLSIPNSTTLELSRSQHTPGLKVLVKEMQSVARLDPEARW